MPFPTFKKGAHPPHRKSATECKPIESLLPTRELVYPMVQHIGAPCVPLVKRGDRVLVGQKIGEAEAFVSAPIHASVSGTVRDVAPRLAISGNLELAVVVENDGLYEQDPSIHPRDNVSLLDPGEIRRIVREAGIVGMGGACFPTAVKLSPPPEKVIRHVIVNGAECEPYLTCDDRLMVEEADHILEGLRIVLSLFPGGVKGHIAVEDNKPEAIETLGRVVTGQAHIEVFPVRTKYPQGAEKMMIYALTGQEVPCGGLPADVGCLMLNVRTVHQIWNAVVLGRPVTDRIVTVSGNAIREPKNLHVRLGTSVLDLVDGAGGFRAEPAKVLAGGPLMGVALSTLDVPVVKGTSGLLAFTEGAAMTPPESACIRCGKCVEVCPMGLLPFALNAAVIRRDYDAFEAQGGMNCLECGCCAYACPSKRHLTQACRDGKRTVAARRRKGAA